MLMTSSDIAFESIQQRLVDQIFSLAHLQQKFNIQTLDDCYSRAVTSCHYIHIVSSS